jgi:hypothetical protein
LKSAHDLVSFTELKADAPGVLTAIGPLAGEVVQAGQMIVRVARKVIVDADVGIRALRSPGMCSSSIGDCDVGGTEERTPPININDNPGEANANTEFYVRWTAAQIPHPRDSCWRGRSRSLATARDRRSFTTL